MILKLFGPEIVFLSSRYHRVLREVFRNDILFKKVRLYVGKFMRYSIRTLLVIVTLSALALAALKSTGEIWVYWYGGLADWYSGAHTHICLLFCVLSLGFIAGWSSRMWVPSKTTKLMSLAAYGSFNVAMYSLARSAIQWVDYASINQGFHVSGAMNMLIVSVNSGVLLVFTGCSLIAIIVASFFRNGKFQEVCGFFTMGCWLVVIAMGFINAAWSMMQYD